MEGKEKHEAEKTHDEEVREAQTRNRLDQAHRQRDADTFWKVWSEAVEEAWLGTITCVPEEKRAYVKGERHTCDKKI